METANRLFTCKRDCGIDFIVSRYGAGHVEWRSIWLEPVRH